MMDVSGLFARNVRVALFEETTMELLEDAIQDWLDARTEERLVFVSFESEATPTSYRCSILYTEG